MANRGPHVTFYGIGLLTSMLGVDLESTQLESILIRKLSAILEYLSPHGKNLKGPFEIAFLDKERIQEINRLRRGIDGATDVISFEPMGEEIMQVGEIYICPQYIWDAVSAQFGGAGSGKKEIGSDNLAPTQSGMTLNPDQKFSKIFEIELIRNLVHGILHMKGYDHSETIEYGAEREAKEEIYRIQEELMIDLFPNGFLS